jgi:hypothetical protein
MTLRELARWYESRLTTGKRDDGHTFYKFKDGSKEDEDRCRALALAAHSDGSMLPDDWRYEFIAYALSLLSETNDPDNVDIEADVYTSELTAWLHSRNDRAGYCDEAATEGLIVDGADMFARLTAGQYLEKREVFDQVRAHLESELDDLTTVDDEDGAA